MHDMNHYIHRQADVMKQALENRRATCQPFVDKWLQVQPKRLYLVGSGTSGTAVRAAADFMQQTLRTETTAVSPTSLPRLVQEKTLFVFVSQGGASTNTLRAIADMKDYPGVALTGEERCPVNDACGCFVRLDCEHEEAGPKTMGYTLTIFTLYEMALEAAYAAGIMDQAEYDAKIAALAAMADAMEENIAAAEQWYQLAQDELKQAHLSLFVGIDAGRFVAQEAALKLQETTLRASIPFEYEEFLHGPIAMYYQKPAGFYFKPVQETADSRRMEVLMGIHRSFTPAVYAIRQGESASADAHTLTLKAPALDWLTPFWQILPAQVVGAKLPAAIGTQGMLHELFVQIDKAVGIKAKGEGV